MSRFEKDFKIAQEFFPKLSFRTSKKSPVWQIEGIIEIQDTSHAYWGSFDVLIKVPKSYPFCVPIVCEKSLHIKRHPDWHISDDGECCIDIGNRLKIEAKKGINILSFIRYKVYSYFANQLYKMHQEEYANGEYKHYTEGILQYYLEDLNFSSIDEIINVLNHLESKKPLDRNRFCPCGANKKIKKCHLQQIIKINSTGMNTIKNDKLLLEEFRNNISSQNNLA